MAYGGTSAYDNQVFFPRTGDGRYQADIMISDANGSMQHYNILPDSVTGEAMLYWMEKDELKYGSMEDLFVRYTSSNHKSWFKVQTVNGTSPNKSKVCFEKIQDVSYHGIKPVWKVTFTNGKSVEITQNHSLISSKAFSCKFEKKTFRELDHVVSIDDFGFDATMPQPVDNDYMTFLGLWIADGSYHRDGDSIIGVRISTGGEINVLEWLEHFVQRYPRYFRDNVMAVHTNSGKNLLCGKKGDVELNRVSLARVINSDVGDVDSYTKRVPNFVFISSNEQIAAFLKGYFSGDGSVHMRSRQQAQYHIIDCSSVNRELLDDISMLLNRLGIKHTISDRYNASKTGYKTKYQFYKITIESANSVKKFMERVGFIKNTNYVEKNRWIKDSRPISLRSIRKIEFIGPKPVYDISVPGTEKFVTNGLCLKNTGADLILLTQADGQRLGYDLNTIRDNLGVEGIHKGTPGNFKVVPCWVMIGTLPPVKAPIGIATDDNALETSLLGDKGILDSGLSAEYNQHGVTYRKLVSGAYSGRTISF